MEREKKIQIGEHDFPQEIVEDILSRLPVDSLLKFRCVSKSWLSLIDSEQFIKIHLKKSTENPCFSHHRIILNSVPYVGPYSSVSTENKLLKMCCWASLLKEPFDINPVELDDERCIMNVVDGDVNIVGCCNGIVCLIQLDTGRFILWNPTTRMSMYLPDAVSIISRVDGENMDFPMYGFGYNESSDDYNVFTVITSNKRQVSARVYSLTSHSWKTLEDEDFPYDVDKAAGVFVSGHLHWFQDVYDAMDYNENKDNLHLFSFDLKNEVFGVVKLPFYSHDVELPTDPLGVIEGCLSVLCYDDDISAFQVWVMKEYGVKESWVKLFTFSKFQHPPLRRQDVVRSFCRGPNGEFLLIYSSTMMVYCYHPEDSEFRCSLITNINQVMGEGFYVESLVSLGPNAREESF